MRRLPLIAVTGLLLAGPLSAQEFLDRGTFVITRGGGEAGRIEFAVRATTGSTGNGGLLTIGTTRTPAHEVQYALETTRDLVPVSYQLTETTGGRVIRRLSAQIAGPRFSAHAITDAGESSRELPVRSPFVILGGEDYTSFLFLPRPDAGASRPIYAVKSETLTPVTGTVTGEGDDDVAIGAQHIACRRYSLRLSDGETSQFWITPTGSLVQITMPNGSLSVTRTQAPTR